MEVIEQEDILDIDIVKASLPSKVRHLVTPELIDRLNQLQDPNVAPLVRQGFINYSDALRETSRVKIEDYVNAVTYVTFKSMGLSNLDAYIKTFPDRVNRLYSEGKERSDICQYSSAYSSNKLVQDILQKNMIAFHVRYQDARDRAMNILMDLALYSKSDKVRCDACNNILSHTEPPKDSPLLQVNIQKNTVINDLEATLNKFAKQQVLAVEQGASVNTCIDVPIEVAE